MVLNAHFHNLDSVSLYMQCCLADSGRSVLISLISCSAHFDLCVDRDVDKITIPH
jgi:hypothetical protein